MAIQAETVAVDRLDRDEILERMEGDVELLEEIVQLFIEDCPRLLAEIGESVAGGDGPSLRLAAHALKGSLSNFGPSSSLTLASELEKMGKSGEMTEAAPVYSSLVTALESLQPAMANLVGK
jgi:two-component system sensor histidine kinase/response regulator